MPGVRFVVGRAGSGKTRHCFRSIVDALRAQPLGPPVYWILPKQATFSAERELTVNSGLNGFCRVRVVSFEELGDEVLAECGGCAIPLVTPLGRQMLLGHLLRRHEPELQFFRGVARQPGLAARLDATFGEFERSGQEPESLDAVIDDLAHAATGDAQSALLRDKLTDLRVLYTAYRAFVGQERLDPHQRLTEMLACVERCDSLRGATVYVDGFTEFSGNERRTLARLARVAERVDVTLLLDPDSALLSDPHLLPDEMSLFHPTETAYRKLWFAFEEEKVVRHEPLRLRKVERFHEPSLKAVERSLFEPRPVPHPPTDGVKLIVAPDPRAEVDAAARQVRQLVASGDVRLRDVAVLARDLDDYHALIDASFREHALPFFVDRRRTAAHHPLLQFVRSVLAIARHGWPHEAVMALLKSGLSGLTLDEADELENYVLVHRIAGIKGWEDPKPWQYERRMTRGGDDGDPVAARHEAVERIDAMRRKVVDRVIHFVEASRAGETRPVRETVSDLFTLFERFHIRPTLVSWMEAATEAGDYEQRGEHEQVWNELVDLLDQMVDLLGDEPIALIDFVEVLETGLERFDLAITPPTVDQVLVGQVDRTRTPPGLHTVIVLGLAEGQFPRSSRQDSMLADEERQTLRSRGSSGTGLDVEPGSERRLLDESFLGYLAFTRAARHLILTRPAASDDGRPLAPSPFWHRVVRTFPGIQPTVIERHHEDDWRAVGTPRQLVTALMRWVRSRPDATSSSRSAGPPPTGGAELPVTDDDDARPALYQWLATYTCCDDAVDVMRFRAWKALSYANAADLSPEVSRLLFPNPLHASVTRIETFATCPFKHYARFGLRLEERAEQDVTAMDLGNVYHQVLERIVGEMIGSHRDWCDPGAVTQEMIRAHARDIGQALRGELMISTARNKYLLTRIENTLSQVVAAQQAAMRRGKFRPAAAELEFRDGGALPPLEIITPNGTKVLLHGKIDRVDLVQDRGDFAVIDYKLGGSALSLARVYHGIALQLLTYLLVLEANGEQLFGRKLTPTAAFYVQLLRKLEDVKHPEQALEPTDPCFDLVVKPRGVFDGRVIEDLDGECRRGAASDVVQAYVTKDGAFGNKDRTDVAEGHEFPALLRFVRRRIAQLADEIVAGKVDIAPYRMAKVTPCAHCEYRSVCRFDPTVNVYHHLEVLGRGEALSRIVREAAGDGA